MKKPLRPVSLLSTIGYALQLPRKALMRWVCCIIPRNVPCSTVFPHPIGIVIARRVKIGDGCKIWQNVTIGNKSYTTEDFPVIGDNVTIYAGAVIVGRITIGSNAVIGANSVVLQNVPNGALAVGNPARIIHEAKKTIETHEN